MASTDPAHVANARALAVEIADVLEVAGCDADLVSLLSEADWAHADEAVRLIRQIRGTGRALPEGWVHTPGEITRHQVVAELRARARGRADTAAGVSPFEGFPDP